MTNFAEGIELAASLRALDAAFYAEPVEERFEVFDGRPERRRAIRRRGFPDECEEQRGAGIAVGKTDEVGRLHAICRNQVCQGQLRETTDTEAEILRGVADIAVIRRAHRFTDAAEPCGKRVFFASGLPVHRGSCAQAHAGSVRQIAIVQVRRPDRAFAGAHCEMMRVFANPCRRFALEPPGDVRAPDAELWPPFGEVERGVKVIRGEEVVVISEDQQVRLCCVDAAQPRMRMT